ncbi:MAG: NTPase [candidate division WOR-3 bacterium]|nr:NTPase [candidate division WOR-3 bacterium]
MFIKNFLLTGLPGVGKTTVVKKIVERYKDKCAGFYTEEIRENNTRVGFKLITLDGQSCIMAHKNIKSPYRVSKYGVNIECIENIGVQAIKDAIAKNKIIIIDEIGKMELYSRQFRNVVIEALNSKAPVLTTILYTTNPFCDKIKERKDVRIFEVTLSNRDELVQKIIELLIQAN